MSTTNKHFDCLRNKLPDNWTNSNATNYYNRDFWKRCPCEYGTSNPSKDTADKWNPTANEPSKWTHGCSSNDGYYNRPRNYYHSYNTDDCGKCNTGCNTGCNNGCSSMNACVTPCGCGECNDVSIVYRMVNPEIDCDNIVELRIPRGGSKEQYLTKFSPEFVYANRFQCATVPVYNACPNNVIDNRRELEFTESDQAALTKRGINNALQAQKLIDEGKLTHNKHSFQIPMNVIGRSAYYKLGDGYTNGSTKTGLAKEDIAKYYFGNCA